MLHLNRFTEAEKQQMLLNLLNKYSEGLTKRQISMKCKGTDGIRRLLKVLEEKGKIEVIEYGNAKLCKIKDLKD